MNTKIIYRVIIDLILVLLIIHGLWFIALPLGFIALWFYPYYVEIILAGFAYDALFGLMPSLGMWGYAGTITSLLIFIILTTAKKVVRK